MNIKGMQAAASSVRYAPASSHARSVALAAELRRCNAHAVMFEISPWERQSGSAQSG
jgi:hypothetical protein